MARTYTTKPARLLKRPAKYARTDLGDEEALRQLGRSYLARPLYPIIADVSTLENYDGNRRIEGVMLIDPDAEVPVCLIDEPWNDSVKLEVQMESDAHTKSLSDYEKWAGGSQWLALNPGATAKDLAARIHQDEGTLCKILSLSRGIDPVKEAARAGQLTYAKWWPICKLPEAEQPAALAAALSGATRDQLQNRSRKNRNGKAASVQAKSIPVILSTGIALTFRADGITLAQALDALAEARKELDDAIKRDHDARTFAALMKKRAAQMKKNARAAEPQAIGR